FIPVPPGRARPNRPPRAPADIRAHLSDTPGQVGNVQRTREVSMEIGGGFFGTIISALFVGLIVGALGRLIVPGKQDMPIWLMLVIGIVAALLGTAIMASFTSSFWLTLIVQVLLAAAGVYLITMMRGGRRRHSPV